MADMKKYELNEELLNNVSGGKLPLGWKKMADAMYPSLKAQYGDVSYQEAKEILATYITDPEDFELVAEYMKKYFPEEQ